jgi:RluA family pseudouridine synthase
MRALRKGEVRLDSARVREAGARVLSGQELYVPWEQPETEPKVKRWGVAPVLWGGDNVVIVDKPSNLLVQPDVKWGDSVITRIWGMFGRGGAGFAPAAVHRLDRNTTGVLAVALSGEALRELERLFKERLVVKRYLAVVVGELPEKGVIDAPLLKDEEHNIVRVVDAKTGKTARTRYTRLRAKGGLSLASIELVTGRTHQARVHMAHIGHPILGDRKYGDIEANRRKREAARPLLHAFELKFPEGLAGALAEVSGRTFRAELPEDMTAVLGGEKFGNLT